MHDPIQSPLALQPKIWDRKHMYVRYMFDSGSQSINFPKEFSKWWKTYYAFPPVLPVHNVQIRLVADTDRTLENLFIHRKPPRDILTRMKIT